MRIFERMIGMAFMMENIDEAVDRKYIITKHVNKQAKPGTMIHVMAAFESPDGITVNYRVTETKQNFTVRFDTLKQFCKWCRPDTFIARHYESLNAKDIMYYMKVSGRSFVTFCLPLILCALVVIWGGVLLLLDSPMAIIVGAILSALTILLISLHYKSQKTQATVRIYSKVGTKKWNVVIK